MAHEIETMMYAGDIPWHGLGRAVPRNVTWEQALELGGLAWDVELRALLAGGRYIAANAERRGDHDRPRGLAVNHDHDAPLHATVDLLKHALRPIRARRCS